tara:strand:- start:6793 stop:6963 length:171 start_codon:yes stop_codon:yes gene_type:complete
MGYARMAAFCRSCPEFGLWPVGFVGFSTAVFGWSFLESLLSAISLPYNHLQKSNRK